MIKIMETNMAEFCKNGCDICICQICGKKICECTGQTPIYSFINDDWIGWKCPTCIHKEILNDE
jgi:hypothetical protein